MALKPVGIEDDGAFVGRAAEWLSDRFGAYELATSFGAVGDGTTDDSAALTAALAACQGRALFLPAGVYKVASAARLLLEENYSSIIGDPSGLGTTIKFTHASGGLDIGNGTDNVYENRLVDILIHGNSTATDLVRMRKVYEPYLSNVRLDSASAVAGSKLLHLDGCGQLDADRFVLANAPIGIVVSGTISPIANIRLANFYNLTNAVKFASAGISKFALMDSWVEDCPDLYTIDTASAFSVGELITDRVRILRTTGNQKLLRLVSATSTNAQVVSFDRCYVEALASTAPLFDLSAGATGGVVRISMSRATVLYANAGTMLDAHASQAWNQLQTDFDRINGPAAGLLSPSPLVESWPKPPVLHGSGAPAFNAPRGSIYQRSDTFPGFYPTLYVKMSDGDTTWHAIGTQRAIATKTSNYALTLADEVIVSNGTTLTMTLPNAALYHGRTWTVKNINSSSCTVGSAGGTINGAATVSLAQWASGSYISDGANWLSV